MRSSSNLTEHLQNFQQLLLRPPNDRWADEVSDACRRLLQMFKNERFSDHSYLPILCSAVSIRGDLESVQQLFTEVFYLRLSRPHLLRHLASAFKRSSPKQPNFEQVPLPSYWPHLPVKASAALWSPSDTSARPLDPAQLPLLGPVVASTLACLDAITSQDNPPWQAFASLLHVMLKSTGHRDWATHLVLRNDSAVGRIQNTATLLSVQTLQRFARMLLDFLLIKPSLLTYYAVVEKVSGASRLLLLYLLQHHATYELTANHCFKFMLEFLNHSSDPTLHKNNVVMTCVAIASKKLDHVCCNAPLLDVYSEFNRLSNAHSLFLVVTEFGIAVLNALLRIYGDKQCVSVAFASSKQAQSARLPPIAKPNYFYSGKQRSVSNPTVAMLRNMDELLELHKSLNCVLKALLQIIPLEIPQLLAASSSSNTVDSMITRNLQQTLCFVLTALQCKSKLKSDSMTAINTEILALDTAELLLHELSSKRALVWITFFNFANDVCYTELALVPLLLRFLSLLAERQTNDNQKLLVSSGLRVFADTFGGSHLKPEQKYKSEPDDDIQFLSREEFTTLYQNTEKTCRAEESHVYKPMYPAAARQQSIHGERMS